MELKDVWIEYCDRHIPSAVAAPQAVDLAPWTALELLFELHPMFTARSGVIETVEYDVRFDDEADGALCQLALLDSFDGWDALTAGGWRVMSERLLWSETVIAANAAKGVEVIAQLPLGLSRERQSRALLLMFLLGGGRTIDPRVLKKRADNRFPGFPSELPIRKQ